jgi:hypothetical protein
MNYGIKKISLNLDMSEVKKKGSKIESAINAVGGGDINYRVGVIKPGEGMLHRHNKKQFKIDLD